MKKIAVIGTGFIGEYMGKGIRKICGLEDLHGVVFGVKGSDRDVEKRARELGYEVTVRNTRQVLFDREPDIIIFSVPPTQAESVLANDIWPYIDHRRKERLPFPDIYSFIPSPGPDRISQMLGKGVKVAKILPNILDTVAGWDMGVFGINYVTYPEGRQWPEENRQVLLEMLSAYGKTVEIGDDDSLVLLAGKITSHVMYEVSYTASDALGVEVNDVGRAMRAAQYRMLPDLPEVGLWGYSRELEGMDDYFEALMRGWYRGLRSFTEQRITKVSRLEAEYVDMCSFALNVFPIRHSSPEQLQQDTQNAATKGGILERGIECYMEEFDEEMHSMFLRAAMGLLKAAELEAFAQRAAHRISREAYRRSLKLS